MIYDLDDYSKATGEWTVSKEYHATDLNEPPLRSCDIDFRHGLLCPGWTSVSVSIDAGIR